LPFPHMKGGMNPVQQDGSLVVLKDGGIPKIFRHSGLDPESPAQDPAKDRPMRVNQEAAFEGVLK